MPRPQTKPPRKPARAQAPTLQAELGKRRPFDSPEVEAFLSILRSASVLSAAFTDFFKAHGLSQSAYNALRILRGATLGPDAPGKRMCHEIGEQLVAQVPDVTRLIDRLEAQGLAQRSRDLLDRRVVFVSITQKGLDLVAAINQPLLDLHHAQLGHMTKAELAELSRLLAIARTPPSPSTATGQPAHTEHTPTRPPSQKTRADR